MANEILKKKKKKRIKSDNGHHHDEHLERVDKDVEASQTHPNDQFTHNYFNKNEAKRQQTENN